MNEARNGRRDFTTSVLAQATGRWIAQVISWSSTVVVARKLSPDDYGVVAMGTVFLGTIGILADFGIGATVLSRPQISDSERESLSTIACAAGVFTFGLCLALSPLLVDYFREPRVFWVIVVMGAAVALNASAAVPMNTLRSRLSYKRVAGIELTSAIATTLTALIGAACGLKYWSLILANLSGALATAFCGHWSCPIRLRFSGLRAIRPLVANSWHVAGGQTAYYAYVYADSLALGRTGGSLQLGSYRFGAFLASLPGEKLVNVVSSVSLAYFGRVSKDKTELADFFLQMSELLALFVFPVLAGMATVAADAVPIVFGERWRSSVILMQVLCVGASIQGISVLHVQVLNATMQAKRYKRIMLFVLALAIPAYFASAKLGGALGIAICWTVLQPLVSLATARIVLTTIDVDLRTYLSRLLPYIVGSAVMVMAVTAWRSGVQLSPSYRLVSSIALGVTVYTSVMLLGFRERVLVLLSRLRAR